MKIKRQLKCILVSLLVYVFAFSFFYGCDKNDIESLISTENSDNTSDTESVQKTDYTDEKDGYTMEVKLNENGKFDYSITPKEQVYSEDVYNQPFKNVFSTEQISGTFDPKRALHNVANIEYSKRDGGAFIYCNNPEKLSAEDVGQALIRNYEMSGDYTFTFEHSNHSGTPFYLGYQLLNTSDTDAVVTVYNIGLQVKGEWLGQKSWSDYFNYKFTLPDDYFLSSGAINPIYVGCDYVNYKPRVFEPVTVTIPAGEYIYILGGTTADAYNETNIGNTANLQVENGKCANGALKFKIEGGKVQGSFYCYTDAAQVKANLKEQGYIVTRSDINYAAQYKGTDYKQGLIESNITFLVNDLTVNGKLPVKYEKEYDASYASKTTPYQEYSLTKKTVTGKTWFTSLNPNSTDNAIGTDMMFFNYIDEEGKPIVIDNEHSDGMGNVANTGNWMVQYTDNFSLVNLGETARTFRIYKKGAISGALFTMVRNEKGEILDARMKANPYYFDSLENVFNGVNKNLLVKKGSYYWFKVADGRPYCDVVDERALVYEITVAPMSLERVSVDYLILGNSNGGISHWVEVDKAE